MRPKQTTGNSATPARSIPPGSRTIAWAAAFLAALVWAESDAADIGLSVALGGGVSTNLQQLPKSDGSGFGTGALDVTLDHASRTVDADIEGRLVSYWLPERTDSISNHPSSRAHVSWTPAIDRFWWQFDGVAGQASANPTMSLLASSAASALSIQTGPTFRQPLGASNFLQLQATYSQSRFGFGYDLEGTTRRGSAELGRQLSATRDVAVGASTRKSEERLSNTRATFDVDGAYVRFDSVGRRNSLSVLLSSDTLHAANARPNQKLAYSLFGDSGIGSRSRIFASASSGWRDASDTFTATVDQAAEIGGTRLVPASASLLRTRDVSVGYVWTGRALTAGIRAGNDNYDLIVRDTLDVTIDWSISPARRFRSTVLIYRQEGTGTVNTRGLDAALEFNQSLSQKLTANIVMARFIRTGDASAFTETRFTAQLVYTPILRKQVSRIGFKHAIERRLQRIRTVGPGAEGATVTPDNIAAPRR